MPSWRTACFRSLKSDGDNAYRKNRVHDSSENGGCRLSTNEDRKGVSFVELAKKEGSTLGLIISGGIDKGSIPKISNIRPGSIAYRCDALAVGDSILSVNGIRTFKLKHEEIVTLLKNTGDRVMLEIEYEMPEACNEEPTSTCSKVIQLKLEKENESFGFTLRCSTNEDRLKTRSLVITNVKPGGPADRDGIVKAGDRLLAVDGINLTAASLQEVLTLLKQISHSALFTIEYDVSVIDVVKNATGPLLVEIKKNPGKLLGLNLTCISAPEYAVVIESIRQASVAERCGALHVGDHVIAINDIKVEFMTSVKAMHLLKSSSSDIIKLEILPFSQLVSRRAPEVHKRGTVIPFYMTAPAGFGNSCYNTFSSLGDPGFGPPGIVSRAPLATMENWDEPKSYSHRCSPLPGTSDVASSSSAFTLAGYADRTEVIIASDHKGFGISLQGSSFSSDTLTACPFISAVEKDSPADKSGVLQITDRILAVNGDSTEGISIEEVSQLINQSYPHVTLVTEFDVAEAVVPSSGIFIVKLVKRGGGFGISLIAPKNRQMGDLIIAYIKKGSVAHRTGSIKSGDKLLAINSIRTENCTVEDATALLQCNNVVKLRIRKDETFSDDPDATCAVVYTVELVRHGGPLGITISGREEPFHPIIISGITPNGLAERTGALHVNDKILAINGNSLKGKTLSEAICILQMCGDTVTLKISKCTCSETSEDEITEARYLHCVPESQMKSSLTPLPSVDSAVDSWDSFNLEASFSSSKIKSNTNGSFSNKNNFPGMFHTACAPESSQGCANSDSVKDEWERKTPSCASFSGSHSLPSDDEKENWHKVLEDLETVGQSLLLRQIERTILGADEKENSASLHDSLRNGFEHPSDTLSEKNLHELNSQIAQLSTNYKTGDNQYCEKVFSSPEDLDHNHEYPHRHSLCCQPGNSYFHPLSPFPLSMPIEIHRVTLIKDHVYEDFGFSLSDGKYEHGVYINSIRSGGPADISGVIKPLDRILQVNNVKTYNAGLIVPLIASSGDRLELVISRPAYDNGSSSESTIGRTSNYLPWMDENEREGSLSPFISHTLTKTL